MPIRFRGAFLANVSVVLALCLTELVASMEEVHFQPIDLEPKANATQAPKPLVFNHKYSINVPGLCRCPDDETVEGMSNEAAIIDNPEDLDIEATQNTEAQNNSQDFVHVHRGYVTPSRYDVDEHGRPYADLFHFNHRIQIPDKQCPCKQSDLQKMKLENKKLRAELGMLEKTFIKRLKAVEKRLKNQETRKCGRCKEEPLLDVIQGTEEEPVIRVLARRHCPSNCSGNGECIDGLCKCRPGFAGKDCKTYKCPNACSGHGSCNKHGKCKCWGKWTAKDCSERACPKDCSGNGVCREGTCSCSSGFAGKDCSIRRCPNDCSKHGRCIDGKCDCQASWEGPDCSVKRCPRNCSSHGVCDNGLCLCEEPWAGKSCNVRRCLNDCHLNGRCRNGTCHCTDDWTGEDCGTRRCPSDCSGFGTCHNGTCACNEGWTGHDCTVLHCPDMCSSNGRCVNHVCVCDDGWEGLNCGSVQSPSNLQVSNIRPTTIDITWKQSGAKITRNQVNCIPMSGTANAVYQSVGPNVTKVTIRDLDSGTQYSVFVYAMVEDALSAPVTASVKTAVDAPSTLSWLRVGPTFVEISWTPPKARIDRYKVVCSCKQGGAEFGVLPNKTSVLIKDLLPGDTYTVSLYAVQGVDVSEPININFTTSLDSPKDLEFVNVTATSAVAQWNRSKARVEGYEISFLQLGSQDADIVSKKVPSSSNQLILTGLNPDTQYNVTLIAFREEMKSLPTQATLIAGIEPPRHAYVTRLLPDAVTLKWESPNDKIRQFRIKVATKRAFDDGSASFVDTVLPETINHASFDDLLPGTEYVAQIHSIDGERNSGALLKKFITGVDAPTNLRPTTIGPKSMTVVWDASNAPVDSYTLSCRDARSGITHELMVDTADGLQATFTALVPLTLYNISIRAEMGESSSQRVSITQLTSLPAPTNLDVAMPTYDDLLVTWNAVIGLADSGFMGLYNVTVSNPDFPESDMEFLVPGSNTRLLVPHLTPGLTYNVELTAQSNNPRVPKSPPTVLSFLAPIDPPTGVTVSMVGYNNATIYWSRTKAPVTEYLVEFRDFDETVEKVTLRVPGNQTFVTLNDLSDDTTYIVNVTAVMGDRSSASGAAILTTDMMMIEPPESLHIVGVTWDSIEVEWMPSITESVQAYLVTCSPYGGNSRDTNVTVGRDDASAVLTSLMPGTLYHISVYALLQYRFSIPAQTSVRTALDPPQDLMFVSVSDRSFTIHWMSPRATVTGYVMTYYRSGVTDERAEVEIQKMSNTYSIHRLEPATEYTVELYSAANGSRSMPTIAMVTTFPAPATRLRSAKQGVDTIAVTWSRPESGEITGYEMRYHPVGQPENERVVELLEDETRHTIRDLLPATFYRIQIQSKRLQDFSEARSITQGTVIPAVKSLRVQPLDDARVTVNWKPTQGVAVEGYRISHRSLDDLGDFISKIVPRDAVTSTIVGLTADTQYSVQVTPTIDGLIGKPRQIKATTGSYLESPEKLKVTNIRENTAEISWDPITDKTISGYLISYKPLGGSTEDAVEKEVMGRKRKSLVLMSLQSATVYYVTVATLRHGRVSFPPAHQRFLTAQMLAPPADVKVYEVTETTIGLEWSTQSADHVEEYHVTYATERGGRTSEIVQAEGEVTRILIEDLQSGRAYSIGVRSFRWGLDSTKDATVEVTTLHVLRRPSGLVVASKNQTGAVVEWRSSTPDADGYDVTVTSSGDAEKVHDTKVNSTKVTVLGLLPGTEYKVVVKTRRNDRLSQASAITFTTDDRLDSPINVTVELIGESGARLRWALPEQKTDAVKIGYRSDDDIDHNVTSLDAGVTSHAITGLRPNTFYHVWLTSSFEARESAETTTNFTTDYIIPPPISLRFSDVTETSMTLNWRRTSERARHFRIVCQSEDGNRKTIIVSWRQTYVPLKSLQSATTYNVSVYGLGNGKESRPLFGTVTTLLGSVRNLSLVEVTSESVLVAWRPPAGIVNRFSVIYHEKGDRNNPVTTEVFNATQANITGLFPGTGYVFQVAAYKKRLRSVSGKKPVQTELDPPIKVRVNDVGRRSANVTWQRARTKHVTGYHVTVLANKKLYRREYNVTLPATHMWLRQLLPDTNYVVRVSTQRGDDVSTSVAKTFKTGAVPFPRPRDCAEVLLNGEKNSGEYDVFLSAGAAVTVRCDMRTDGGGWVVVQRRSDGSENFDRDWRDYVDGFGEPNGREFWLGLDNMHLLTTVPQELRIDLRHNAKSAYATFSDVTISDEESGHVIQGGNYMGNAGDSLTYHFGMKFTARDVDYDTAYGRNCAREYGGAWWYRNCHRSSLNGQYNNTRHSQGINWFTWGGFTRSMEFVEMKMRPKNLRRSSKTFSSGCRGNACHGR